MATALAAPSAASIDEALADCLAVLAPSTRLRTEYRIRGWLELHPDPLAVRPAQIQRWAYGPTRWGAQPAAHTIRGRLVDLGGYYRALVRAGLLDRSPVDLVPRPRPPALLPRGLSHAEAVALLRSVPCARWRGLRTLALFVGLLLTGLRVSEWLALRRSDLEERQLEDGRRGWTFRVRVKGGAERRRELPSAARLALEAYLAARGTPFELLPATARLWPWSRDLALYLCRTYGRKAGIPRLCPHRLRHTCARLRREAGATVHEIQDVLGHASESYTERYLTRAVPVADPGADDLARRLGLEPKL